MAIGDDRRVRIGVIGTGWWATTAHLPSLKSYPAAEVAAIADPNPERLERAGDTYEIERRYSDYRTMIEREQLDAVIVATPHATHYDIASDVLQHKLGLLLEKPMVLRAREARALTDLAARQNVPLIVGYPWHFVPQHQRLRDAIIAGRLGQIQFVSNHFASMVVEYYRGNPLAYQPVFNWPVTGPSPTTYSEPSIAGGGQGHLQVTHAAGLLLWLTGLRPVSVGAFMENLDCKVDVCDAITVRFDNGAIGTLSSTGTIPVAHSGTQQLEYRIYGTEGFALLDVMTSDCRLHFNDGRIETLEPTPREGRYPSDLTSRHLVDVMLGRAENQSPGEIGARTVELIDGAYTSAATGRFVRMDEL